VYVPLPHPKGMRLLDHITEEEERALTAFARALADTRAAMDLDRQAPHPAVGLLLCTADGAQLMRMLDEHSLLVAAGPAAVLRVYDDVVTTRFKLHHKEMAVPVQDDSGTWRVQLLDWERFCARYERTTPLSAEEQWRACRNPPPISWHGLDLPVGCYIDMTAL